MNNFLSFIVKLILLYWLAFGIVGLLETYVLVVSNVDITGKPTTHELQTYLIAFLFRPMEQLSAAYYAQTSGLELSNAAKLDLAVSAVFVVFASYGLLVKRYRLVVVAVLLPVIYRLYSFL